MSPCVKRTHDWACIPTPKHVRFNSLNEAMTWSSTRPARLKTSSTANCPSGKSATAAAKPRIISRCTATSDDSGS
eukprot:2186794-Prymnesium_polylepis.1